MLTNLIRKLGGMTSGEPRLAGHWTERLPVSMDTVAAVASAQRAPARSILGFMKDDDLQRLNSLLPWSCFVIDAQGRRFGKAWSATKRSQPQAIPDYRIVELNRRFPLAERDVFEIGCFEGVHTAALSSLARRVMAADSRIENVVKTIVRCAVLGQTPFVFPWNVEEGVPVGVDMTCDVLHHVGVLYHLVDPVRHLREVLPHVREALLLDTHVASPDAAVDSYMSGTDRFPYQRYREGGREEPFAGMADHAKWLREEDLVGLLQQAGFHTIDVAERRQERNGPRVLIFASR